MPAWLDERLAALVPQLAALTSEQEAEIARLCEDEIAAWRARPQIKKPTALRPVMTAARKALRGQLKVTPANRWKNPRTGEYEHIALKHLNFTPEEWDGLNAVSEERLETRLQHQQLIDQPEAVIERAERLLQSDRWYDLVTGLAVVTGRRLTELMKTGRFFQRLSSTQ
jgi:Spy/CpxP family protein refolding chaperone